MTVTALRFDRDGDCIEGWSSQWLHWGLIMGSDCTECWSWQWLHWVLIMTKMALSVDHDSDCIECWSWQRLHWVLIITVTALSVDHDSDCTECWSWQWLHWVLIMTAALLSVDRGQWWHLTWMNSDLWSVGRRGLHYVLKTSCVEWWSVVMVANFEGWWLC